jgi:hypothetical protein
MHAERLESVQHDLPFIGFRQQVFPGDLAGGLFSADCPKVWQAEISMNWRER